MSDETTQTQPTLEELKTRARELDIAGRSGMDRDALEAAIAAKVAGGGPADVADAANATRGDVGARAEANAVGDTVTAAPAGGMVRVGARVELDAEAERASKRSIYRDTNNRRRVVGAGQVIPAGWTFVEDASLAKRVAEAEQSYGVTDKAVRGPRD